MEIRTARLLLRRPSLADAPELFAFLGDAEAMRHTHRHESLRECRRRLALHERRRRRDGCAPWTVLCAADGRIVGWGGLFEDPFAPGWGVELGYWFHPSAWGLGYASELAAAATAHADRVLRLPELRAFGRPDNAASRRVLEKTGFAAVRFLPGIGRLLYRRPRPEAPPPAPVSPARPAGST